MIDREFFFQRITRTILLGAIRPQQRSGFMLLLDRWEKTRNGEGDRRQLAYILATAWHETAATMQPIRERGGKAYFLKQYDVAGQRPALARSNGNTQPGDGARYCGRGYVQLTWKNNYRRIGALIGVDLVGDPDRALEPEIAATILIRGMEQGWFTGRELSHYFSGSRAEWVQARRIVNSLDQAALIADYARRILAAMRESEQDSQQGSQQGSATSATPRLSASRPSPRPSPVRQPRRVIR